MTDLEHLLLVAPVIGALIAVADYLYPIFWKVVYILGVSLLIRLDRALSE